MKFILKIFLLIILVSCVSEGKKSSLPQASPNFSKEKENASSNEKWKSLNIPDEVSERDKHTAVWTGQEVLIWGGCGGDGLPVQDHWAVNPKTKSLRKISNVNSPGFRCYHSAVWTGSKMIIWGGGPGGGHPFLSTGGIYDPGTDSWTSLVPNSAFIPSGRINHSAVWTGSEMIIWGGRPSWAAYSALNDGAKFNLASESWTPMASTGAPTPRYSHSAVWGNGKMLLWGGGCDVGPSNCPSSSVFGDGYLYDPDLNLWGPMNSSLAPSPRVNHSAIWTGDKMIIWGGAGTGDHCPLGRCDDGGLYNSAQNSWAPLSSNKAPEARRFHSGVWTGKKMIIWGGTDDQNLTLNSGGIYNPATQSWESMEEKEKELPEARWLHTGLWTDSGFVIFGGRNSSVLNSGSIYVHSD